MSDFIVTPEDIKQLAHLSIKNMNALDIKAEIALQIEFNTLDIDKEVTHGKKFLLNCMMLVITHIDKRNRHDYANLRDKTIITLKVLEVFKRCRICEYNQDWFCKRFPPQINAKGDTVSPIAYDWCGECIIDQDKLKDELVNAYDEAYIKDKP